MSLLGRREPHGPIGEKYSEGESVKNESVVFLDIVVSFFLCNGVDVACNEDELCGRENERGVMVKTEGNEES